MIDGLIHRVSEVIATYGAWGVFAASVLEEVIAPIPSSLTIMGAGFVLLAPYTSFWAVIIPALLFVAIPAALGMTVGGLLIYGLTYFSGNIIIDRWGKWFDLTHESIEKTKKRFESGKRDELVLVALRATPIFPNSLISGVCGLIHYPLRPFLIFSFLGGIPRAFLMALIGWGAESAYVEYANTLSGLENYVIFGTAILGAGFLFFFFLRRRKKLEHESS